MGEHRRAGRQAGRLADRQTDRQTGWQRDVARVGRTGRDIRPTSGMERQYWAVMSSSTKAESEPCWVVRGRVLVPGAGAAQP